MRDGAPSQRRDWRDSEDSIWSESEQLTPWRSKTRDQLELENAAFEAMTQDVSVAVADFKEVEWLIEGVLPKGALILVGGAPKVSRKTLLVMGIALGVANGRGTVLGKPTKYGDVIFANLEDGENRCRNRIFSYGVRTFDYGRRRDYKLTLVTKLRELRYLQGHIRLRKPALVVIDPLVELGLLQGITDENDAHQMSRMLRTWRELAHETGTTILVVHHYRKGGDTMRGSSVLEGAADGWWEIRYTADDKPRILQFTLRDADPGEVDVNVRYEGSTIKMNIEGEYRKYHTSLRRLKNSRRISSDSSEERDPALLAKIRKLLVEEPERQWTQRALREELGCRKAAIIDMIGILRADGMIASKPGGGYIWIGNGVIPGATPVQPTEQ